MTAYRHLRAGKPVSFAAKSTSFKQFAESLHTRANSAALGEKLPYWLALADHRQPPFPLDHPDGMNAKDSLEAVNVGLDEEHTQRLLEVVKRLYRSQMNHILLAGLAVTVGAWTSSRRTLINIESHGRESQEEAINVSRTTGWFTSFYPVALLVGFALELRSVLDSVGKQLDNVPNRGIGYAILRYLSPNREVTAKLEAMPGAEIAFNYTGQHHTKPGPGAGPGDAATHESGIWQSIDEMRGWHRKRYAGLCSQYCSEFFDPIRRA